ncbi:MAG: phage portal protein [Clostridia bacterium]|nr:phage portal protein [Clostridia bacterium]
MEIRNMFSRIFGKQKQPSQNLTQLRMLNGYSNEYTPFNGVAYDNATVRSCVDTIARHASKLNPRHIVKKDGKVVTVRNDRLNYLLSVQPNPLMTSAEFLEKLVNQYFTTNNLFVYVQRDASAEIVALWPLDFSQVSLYEDSRNVVYVKFIFGIGLQTTVPYDDIIHIRRYYNRDEMFGDPEAKILQEDLTLLKAVKSSIINVVKNYGRLRGIVKFMQTLRPEDMKKHFEEFVTNFVSDVKNGSGIAPMESSMARKLPVYSNLMRREPSSSFTAVTTPRSAGEYSITSFARAFLPGLTRQFHSSPSARSKSRVSISPAWRGFLPVMRAGMTFVSFMTSASPGLKQLSISVKTPCVIPPFWRSSTSRRELSRFSTGVCAMSSGGRSYQYESSRVRSGTVGIYKNS